MEKRLSEVEAILKVSGIASASLLPEEVKGRVCHSVAIDIVAHYEPLIQQAKAEVAREMIEEIKKVENPYPLDSVEGQIFELCREAILKALEEK
jgi:hypothetical protein